MSMSYEDNTHFWRTLDTLWAPYRIPPPSSPAAVLRIWDGAIWKDKAWPFERTCDVNWVPRECSVEARNQPRTQRMGTVSSLGRLRGRGSLYVQSTSWCRWKIEPRSSPCPHLYPLIPLNPDCFSRLRGVWILVTSFHRVFCS